MIPVSAYIALGSNLGDREQNIAAAIDALRNTPDLEFLRVSTLIENPAVGGPLDSPAFLNGVAEIRTTLDAQSILACLLQIEHQMGRIRRHRWEPRLIDLDIILYGDQIIRTETLTIPHPMMHERRFVLEPFAQIAANAVHPVFAKTIGEMLQALPASRSPNENGYNDPR
jgi:2-amino-4-hydroxy-6-hydroxymethyldihydropteridine diphosphokinase